SWIADRDRFSYLGLNHAERLLKPMVKRDGQWQEVDWNSALAFAAEGLKAVLSQHGASQLGALAAYGATTEEHYLLQKVLRGLGCHNVDHRLRQIDFRDDAATPAFPALGHTLPELETRDAVLLIGSNVRKEQPLIAHRLRKASLKGAQMMAINALDYEFTFPLAAKSIATPAGMVHALAGVVKALASIKGTAVPVSVAALVNGVAVDATQQQMAQLLAGAKAPSLLLGNGAIAHPYLAELRALAAAICVMSGARLGVLAEGGNSAGAWLAGMVPNRLPGNTGNVNGTHWHGMCANGVKGLVLLGVEPEFDAIDAQCAANGVRKADFVVALTPYATAAMRDSADVLLPIALFPETSGTYVNVEGSWQSVPGVVTPPGDARPAWKVLRVFGNMLDLNGFEYMTSEEVRDELRALCAGVTAASTGYTAASNLALPQLTSELTRVSDFPIYSVDPLVRRSAPLQQTRDAQLGGVRGSAATLAALGLRDDAEAVVSQGSGEIRLKVSADERVVTGCLYVPCGGTDGVCLGAGFGPLTVRPA
ncbi:MAG TPA: molybdopterin-dependent oxidoreductase, partial [Gammaproteobacteria bacterium]